MHTAVLKNVERAIACPIKIAQNPKQKGRPKQNTKHKNTKKIAQNPKHRTQKKPQNK
jgi:hypothetical protein